MPAGTSVRDKAEELLALLQRSKEPEISSPTLVSGTARQDTTGVSTTYYIQVTGAGSTKVQIGAAASVATEIVPTFALAASTGTVLTVKLPASWYIKVTTTGTLGTVTVTT